MRSKIGLALALALFALGINQANAATILFSCTDLTRRDSIDLQVDTATGWIVGPAVIMGTIDSPTSKAKMTCSIDATRVFCRVDGGLVGFQTTELSRLTGHLTALTLTNIFQWDCKLVPKKLF